jgi:transposase-like protein
MGKIRRKFDVQFKIRVAEAIVSGAAEIGPLCREQQLSRTVVERWVARYRDGTLGATASRERELERTVEKLQAKIGELTMTIDILKKAATWKQQQRSASSSVISGLNWAPSTPPAKPSDSPSLAITTSRKKAK